MVYVPPPPLLVVRSHDPARHWRAVAAVALGWLASVAVAAAAVVLLREHIAVNAGQEVVARLTRDDGDLRQRVAVLERSEQVARAANADLQQVLRDRQEQISALRADLGFYARLTGSGARREGLAVQGLHLGAAAE